MCVRVIVWLQSFLLETAEYTNISVVSRSLSGTIATLNDRDAPLTGRRKPMTPDGLYYKLIHPYTNPGSEVNHVAGMDN